MKETDSPVKVVDIKVGYACNNNCFFCAQAANRFHGDKDTAFIKKELSETRSQGCDKVVLTGGEVTIRKDVLELVRYAKELGFASIQIQTNGRAFYYKNFCQEMIDAGANEFAIALHGHIPEVHDYLTRSPGSFMQTVQGIINLKELGQKVVLNSVIVKPNYRYAEQLVELLVKLEVDQFQLAFVHPCSNAGKYYDKMVPFVSIAAPFIHKGLQVGIDAGIFCMAEAMPFCVMQGYERCVSEFYIPSATVKEYDFTLPNYDVVRKDELKSKFPQCKECKYELICEGPWKEYPERKGSTEFQPVKGDKIADREKFLESLNNPDTKKQPRATI